ncbi:MAG: hypothetical protein M3Y27_13030 [Acidobacteriota bacterium]|nr:hypothetical protein [Acidobacteriota bacterium]
MTFTRRIVSLVLLASWISFGHAQDAAKEVAGAVTGVVAPGATLLVPVSGYTSVAVTLHSVAAAGKSVAVLNGMPAAGGLKILLPSNLDLGSYYFTLSDNGGNNDIVVPGSIDVAPASIKLVSIHPSVVYKGDADDFNFDLVGENFSKNSIDDDVTIDGHSIVKARAASETDCQGKEGCLWVENSRTMHLVGYRAEKFQGIVKVGVRVGNVVAADEKPLVLARHSWAFIIFLSVLATLALFGAVCWIVAKGVSKTKVGGKPLWLLQTFIFDPQTNSYSLSKFQLMMFSATFIFGYVYVMLSRLFVQWQFSLPDVPTTIAGLLGVSGGTVIAATALTAGRGSKGAGLQHPTWADMISTGGVVVPERFQFFVWTIIACFGFTVMLIGQDPGKLSNFPDIPTGLLYLMGVSAGGYLGGKATRKAGPSLEYIGIRKPDGDRNFYTLIVQGHNLNADGRLFIDDTELGFPSEADALTYHVKTSDKLVKPTAQMGTGDQSFSKQLEIGIANSAVDLSHGTHKFRIANQDGQFADLTFPDPSIDSVYERGKQGADCAKTLRAIPQTITAVVTGFGLENNCTASWKAPGASSFTDLAMAQGGPCDGTALWVSIMPGEQLGRGTLKVTTASGTVMSAMVQVGGDSSVPAPQTQTSVPAQATTDTVQPTTVMPAVDSSGSSGVVASAVPAVPASDSEPAGKTPGVNAPGGDK